MLELVKQLQVAFSQLLVSIFASIFLAPVSLILPKKKGRITVIGRHNGLFMDNTKYFYLYLCGSASPKPDVEYIALSQSSYEGLLQVNLPVCKYPGFRSIRYLLTSKIVVVDNAEWIHQCRFQLAFGSKVVQLWHGIPLKQIEIPRYLEELQQLPLIMQFLYRGFKYITGRFSKNEIVISTSEYCTNKAFGPAFNAKYFLNTGYPRNDVFFESLDHIGGDDYRYINADIETITYLTREKGSFERVILYAPTFRKDLENPFSPEVLDLDRLNEFAVSNKVLFVFKLHPVLEKLSTLKSYSNILNYHTTCDIYPALKYFDALITDYSSIYFDFLLLDRPIIFYPFDIESYISDDRSLVFEYDSMTPGVKCLNQDSLEESIRSLEEDFFSNERKKILDLSFDYKDGGSSERLWGHLYQNYLN